MKTTNPTKTKPPTIHIGKNGGVRVDADEFFARPGVQEKIEKMSKMKIVGVVMNSAHMSSKKESKNSE